MEESVLFIKSSEFIDIAGITASSKAEAKEAAAEKQNWFMRAIKLLGDIFVPIIPAIVASGFLMGIMNSLDFMNSNGFLHINTHSSKNTLCVCCTPSVATV